MQEECLEKITLCYIEKIANFVNILMEYYVQCKILATQTDLKVNISIYCKDMDKLSCAQLAILNGMTLKQCLF